MYPCLYWPTVLRIHGQSVVYSHTRPNIAESVSMPLLTHCAENPPTVCGLAHTRPNIAESVSMPLLTHCAENPLAGCGLLAHKAQYCRKCIYVFSDSLCWESTGSLWFTRTQGPILQKVYPCLYWPTVLRIHWQSVAYSHTRPNVAESKLCISNSIVTNVSVDRTAQSSMHKMPGCQSASSDVVVSPQYFWFINDSTHYCVLL